MQKILKIIKIFFINLILVYFILYFFELYINYSNKTLFNKSRTYYVNELNKKNPEEKFYLNFTPSKLLDNTKYQLLPLSGYKNSNIIICLDQENKPIYYLSDRNGFNNQTNNFENIDYLLIGDSFVQGYCVKNKYNLNGQFIKKKINTVGLGIGGNGPLLEYATFKEYEKQYKYKNIILFITPDNDFYDLYNEKNNKILLKYLKQENFTQNLKSIENEKIKTSILDNFFKKRIKKPLYKLSPYHFDLKQTVNLIEKIFKTKNNKTDEFYYLKDKEVDKIFLNIIKEFKNAAKSKKVNFFIVINALHPNIIFPRNGQEKILKKILINKIKFIEKSLLEHNIKFLNYNNYVINNYNKNNIVEIYKKINNNFDHYTKNGYEKLVIKILEMSEDR